MPGEYSTSGSSEDDLRFRGAEIAADIRRIPESVDSLELRQRMATLIGDALIAARRYELAHGQEPELRNGQLLLTLLGGEDNARQKYGDELINALKGGEN